MKILEVIQRSAEFLTKRGVSSPRLQVELILAHVLVMPRMRLYLSFEQLLTEPQLAAIRSFVQRRGNHEPLQYILGVTSFCGLDMTVNPRVLIPRPETELLAERAWKYLLSLSESSVAPVSALDFGTGSGCIAVAMAAHAPNAQISALDISDEALSVARENAARHKTQVLFYLGNGFSALPEGAHFNLIVSNPPYISKTEIETLDLDVRDHEPHGALDGGIDGLDYYRLLAGEAPRFLLPGGCLMVEFGDGQAGDIQTILEQQNWIVEAVEADYTQRLRILIARCGSV